MPSPSISIVSSHWPTESLDAVHVPRDHLGNHIKLQIDAVALGVAPEGRFCKGRWNQGNLKPPTIQARNGERDTVHRDRSLGHEQRIECRIEADAAAAFFIGQVHFENSTHRVNMTLHDVSTKQRCGRRSMFEIDPIAPTQPAEGRQFQRLGDHVEAKDPAAEFRHRQAATIHGDRLARRGRVCPSGRINHKPTTTAPLRRWIAADAAYVLDQSGEHREDPR